MTCAYVTPACDYHIAVFLTGSSCDKEKGFCDHFQKCRLINVQGPLARLKDLFFSESSLNQLKNWVTVREATNHSYLPLVRNGYDYVMSLLQEYWYVVAVSIVALIGLMVLFVKCCAVHTPSSNPHKAPARQLSQTLTLRRRRANQPPASRQSAAAQRVSLVTRIATHSSTHPPTHS